MWSSKLPFIRRAQRWPSSRSCNAGYHDFFRATVAGQNIRVSLTSPKVVGFASSRGSRPHQEDFHTVSVIQLSSRELQTTLKRTAGLEWGSLDNNSDYSANQVLFAGLYDGHGGPAVSEYLHKELHLLFESVDATMIPEVFGWIKSFGGYFKRFRGGALTEWIEDPNSNAPLDLDARATLAFLTADNWISSHILGSTKIGSTATVAMLHPLDLPVTPFFSARRVALTVAHCGDTRVILCATDGGQALGVTEKHHADSRGEAARLRRLGAGLVTDSYGEARWMGAVENTRGLGDSALKRFGVTPEPEMSCRLLHAPDWAYIIMVSDGVSSILSDQEIADVVRYAKTPGRAATDIITFAEELGTEDNASAIVLPLAGWGHVRGPDKTKDLRVYRQNQAVGSERQRTM